MTVGDLKIYKNSLYAALSRDLSEFEKNFLLISAGTLTFSITFIKDIVNVSEASCIYLLFVGWFLITISIGLMMSAFIKSAYASDEIWFIVDDFLVRKNLLNDTIILQDIDALDIKQKTDSILKKSKRQLKRIRNTAISSFLIGILTFGLFVGKNIYKENQKEKNNILNIQIEKKSQQVVFEGVKITVNDSILVMQKASTNK